MKTKQIAVLWVSLSMINNTWALEPTRPDVSPATKAVAEMRARVNPGNMVVLRQDQPFKFPDLRYIHVGTPARQAAGATMSWNNAGLQVVFDCIDDGIVASQQGRDNVKLWKDDSIYVWLDIGHTHNPSNLIMVQVSAGGAFFDARNGDPKFDVEGLEVETTRTNAGWRAKIRLPWKGLGVACPKPGDVWGLNLTRVDQPGKYDFYNSEYTSWAVIPSGAQATGCNMSDVDRWGHVIFARAEVKSDDPDVASAEEAIRKVHTARSLALNPVKPVAAPAVAATNALPWQWRALHLCTLWPRERLEKDIPMIAGMGINVLILQVDYDYEYESHPELRGRNLITKERARKIAELCRTHGIRLIPQFECLGHQEYGGMLLKKYPEFDLTPGFTLQKGHLIFKEWDPLNPKVNEIVFQLMDELLDAFQADALLVGMDEIFSLGDEHSPSTKGKNPAELFAKAVNDYYDHLVKKRKVEMLMWGDRLIDQKEFPFYNDCDASAAGTAPAIDMIPKDIIVCDWHYGPIERGYPSIPMFIEKGFRVLPSSWQSVKGASWLVEYSMNQQSPLMLGHLFTTWNEVKDIPGFAAMWEGLRVLKTLEPAAVRNPNPNPSKKEDMDAGGVVDWLRNAQAVIHVQGQVPGLSNDKDLKMTEDAGIKTFQGTLTSENVAFKVAQRVAEERIGVRRVEIEVSADGQVPASSGKNLQSFIYSLQVPAWTFAGGVFEADDMAGPLPVNQLPTYEIKLFHEKVKNIRFTAPNGLKLNVELEPATDITIQDSRQWSPNFSVPIAVPVDNTVTGGKAKLTLRLSLD